MTVAQVRKERSVVAREVVGSTPTRHPPLNHEWYHITHKQMERTTSLLPLLRISIDDGSIVYLRYLGEAKWIKLQYVDGDVNGPERLAIHGTDATLLTPIEQSLAADVYSRLLDDASADHHYPGDE